MKNRINSKKIDYIVEHNNNPLDFMYAIMRETKLTDDEALEYLSVSFGYKYTEDELKKIITQYHKESERIML